MPFSQVLGFKDAFSDSFARQVKFLKLSGFKPESSFSVMPSGDIISDADLDTFLCDRMFEEEFDFTVMDQSSVASTVVTHKSFQFKALKPRMIKTQTLNPESLGNEIAKMEDIGSFRQPLVSQMSIPLSGPGSPDHTNGNRSLSPDSKVFLGHQDYGTPVTASRFKNKPTIKLNQCPVEEAPDASAERCSLDSDFLVGKSPSRRSSASNEPSMMRGEDQLQLSVINPPESTETHKKKDAGTPTFSTTRNLGNFNFEDNTAQEEGARSISNDGMVDRFDANQSSEAIFRIKKLSSSESSTATKGILKRRSVRDSQPLPSVTDLYDPPKELKLNLKGDSSPIKIAESLVIDQYINHLAPASHTQIFLPIQRLSQATFQRRSDEDPMSKKGTDDKDVSDTSKFIQRKSETTEWDRDLPEDKIDIMNGKSRLQTQRRSETGYQSPRHGLDNELFQNDPAYKTLGNLGLGEAVKAQLARLSRAAALRSNGSARWSTSSKEGEKELHSNVERQALFKSSIHSDTQPNLNSPITPSRGLESINKLMKRLNFNKNYKTTKIIAATNDTAKLNDTNDQQNRTQDFLERSPGNKLIDIIEAAKIPRSGRVSEEPAVYKVSVSPDKVGHFVEPATNGDTLTKALGPTPTDKKLKGTMFSRNKEISQAVNGSSPTMVGANFLSSNTKKRIDMRMNSKGLPSFEARDMSNTIERSTEGDRRTSKSATRSKNVSIDRRLMQKPRPNLVSFISSTEAKKVGAIKHVHNDLQSPKVDWRTRIEGFINKGFKSAAENANIQLTSSEVYDDSETGKDNNKLDVLSNMSSPVTRDATLASPFQRSVKKILHSRTPLSGQAKEATVPYVMPPNSAARHSKREEVPAIKPRDKPSTMTSILRSSPLKTLLPIGTIKKKSPRLSEGLKKLLPNSIGHL